MSFVLNYISDDEAANEIKELDYLAGIEANLAVIPDLYSSKQNESALLATLKAFTPIARAQVDTRAKRYDLEERL